MAGIYSGQRAQVRQDFGMNRLESNGSNGSGYSMGMSFMGKGVNPSYTPSGELVRAIHTCKAVRNLVNCTLAFFAQTPIVVARSTAASLK